MVLIENLTDFFLFVQEIFSEILFMCKLTVNKLLEEIRNKMHCLYVLSESISSLDLLHAFATYVVLSDSDNYCKPL